MKKAKVWYVLLLAACASRAPTGSVNPGQIEHQIAYNLAYSSYQDWQNSEFYRISLDHTAITPIFVLVDKLGYGCVVPGAVWALNPTYAACATRWRAPRPKLEGA